MSEMPADAGLPTDPFQPHLPEFENITGPNADEIRRYVKEFSAAYPDYNALMLQESFAKLHVAIAALDEERVRAVLLRAIASSVADLMRDDPQQFRRWVEAL
jgi:hypothetical protein